MFFVVKVNRFNGSANRPAVADKNGMEPIILESFNGNLPNNAKVLSGTVAASLGFEVGKLYMVKITRTHVDPQYGDQFRFSVMGGISPIEFAQNIDALKKGVIQSEVTESTPVAAKVPVGAGIDEDKDED